jgi:hypothetical protein
MHLRKMLLKYGGMVPTPSGSEGYRETDTMVRGRGHKNCGKKIHVGIH